MKSYQLLLPTTHRYGSPTSPTASTFPAPTEAKTTTTPTSAPSQSFGHDNDEEERTSHYSNYSSYSSSAPANPVARKSSVGRPPKPSLFNRLNFLKRDSGGRKAPPARVQRDPRDRIYKQRLAKTPDWDRLPLAQTLYNYKGELRCDLEFRKGQVIQVMTRTETQEDWWEGRLEGRVGIFPANYVRLL